MKILTTKKIWLRNSSCMNDSSEVEHGLNCLGTAYRNLSFRKTLGKILECPERFEEKFNEQQESFKLNTFLGCFSEHDDTEDRFGRLSMWRAYGRNTGVAFVMNNNVFLQPSDALGAYTYPVAYLNDEQFTNELKSVSINIDDNIEFLRKCDQHIVEHYIFQAFKYAALCTKHPGFFEEREWRVIFSPRERHPGRISTSIQCINGVPQEVCEVPLHNIPEENLIGMEPSSLIDRVIIGPSQFPMALYDSFVGLLGQAGVTEPHSKVVVSDIPLRE